MQIARVLHSIVARSPIVRVWSLILWWLALTAIYCLLVSPLSGAEVAAGCGAALLASVAVAMLQREAGAWFALNWHG